MSSLVDGAYFIRNAAAKTVIDVGTSTEPYPKLAGYEYKFDSIDRQLFNVRTVGASTYIIWHQATGRVFDLEESNPGNGTPIITFPLHWGNNQLWKITSASSGYTVESVSSGKFMDLGGSSTVDGTPIVIWQGTGNDNQVWEFKKVGPLVI